MNQLLRPAVTLTALLLAVAPSANAGAARTAASQSTPVVPAATAKASPQATPSAVADAWTSWMSPWSALPSRFDEWSWSAIRVEWDPEAAAWGPATAHDGLAAGVFGARLPSDRPVQITRSDGTVGLLIGPEGMEYLSVHRGPDGRFHPRCGHDHESGAAPAVEWAEK